MKYVAIRSEGGLIPYDLLDKIASEDVPGQKPSEFGLPKGRRLSDEIQRVWSDAQDLWDIFHRRRDSLPEKDPHGTTLTRERWIVPLLTDPQILAYSLSYQPSAIVLDGLTFPISHRAGESDESPPVDIEGFKIDLDHRAPKLRTSPRAMVQEFLNHSEAQLWGIVTNGLSFRLLRDTARTARPSYLEFDLENILQAGLYNEFALFYRLCHRSRLPLPGQAPEECLLERYYQLSIEQGGRVRDKLRDGVEETLRIFGAGFLRHPDNQPLRDKIVSGSLNVHDYHRQLLRLVYRLLFLIVAEERRMIVATGDHSEKNQRIYADYYSVGRLRERAEGIIERSDFSDLWVGLKKTFSLFSDSSDRNPLDIPPLNGDLFSSLTMPDLDGTSLYNHDLLLAIRKLSLFHDGRVLQRVNYSALDVEELGSVYESLLDYRPAVEAPPEGLKFELETGGERKSTGSYYTRPELVRELIHSALVPVLEDRLAGAIKQAKTQTTEGKTFKEKAILGISVCDPACGSGHFLLEAARRLGKELARVRTDEDEPSPEQFHLAVRDVVSHCIYGVDINPLAVDLCKLALWLEGYWIGKPLSFLDHRIKSGNSLLGVLGPGALEKGIPDDAFTPVTGDDKKVAAAYKKRNKKERETLLRRFDFEAEDHLRAFSKADTESMDFAELRPEDVRRKEALYRKAREEKDWLHDWTAANLWTAAFFVPLTRYDDPVVPTDETFIDYLLHGKDRPQLTGRANALFYERRFFHWRLEFPEVFAKDGFDVVLGNPPWERIRLEEQEHWADDPYIAKARNKAERTRRIEEYRASQDAEKRARVQRFDSAKNSAETLSKFVRESGRFPLTAVGDVNTYALFADLAFQLLRPDGRAGVLLPTGIATDDTTKEFFGDLARKQTLASLIGFENEAFIFPSVHHSFKFCAFTMTGQLEKVRGTDFAFFCRRFEDVNDKRRHFALSADDLVLLNPNTRTCPVFRSAADAELTKKIYRRVPVLLNEITGANFWGIEFLTMFHMSGDSDLFFESAKEGLVPLYEAKMIHQFDHRYGTYEGATQAQLNVGTLPQPDETRKRDPRFTVLPRYWVARAEAETRWGAWKHGWAFGFRDITSNVVERTSIFTVVPRGAMGNSLPLMLPTKVTARLAACLLGNLNGIALDYVARQKIAGTHMNFFFLQQLPVVAPESYSENDVAFVVPRVLELVYTALDIKHFAEDAGYVGEPFRWTEDRRVQLRAELDAYYAHLYALTRDEMRYMLDPKDVFGDDFPSETFRVLKEREETEFGEYRTRRLVLEAFDKLAESPRFRDEMPKRASVLNIETVSV